LIVLQRARLRDPLSRTMIVKNSTSRTKEAELDVAFEDTAKTSVVFVNWLLTELGYAGLDATLVFSRSDNPWYRGVWNGQKRDSETDVLLVFEIKTSGERFAFHIENKINSPFEPDQPELYKIRAADCANKLKWGNYQSFKTVLIAPRSYFDLHQAKASIFDHFIAHEDLAMFIPKFGRR
jgi:hypothetical protein